MLRSISAVTQQNLDDSVHNLSAAVVAALSSGQKIGMTKYRHGGWTRVSGSSLSMDMVVSPQFYGPGECLNCAQAGFSNKWILNQEDQ